MTPSKDYRSGEFVAAIFRPRWSKKDLAFYQILQNPYDPKSYSNFIERNNLPTEVAKALDNHEVVYWRIRVGEGRVQFLSPSAKETWSTNNMGQVFDKENQVKTDELAIDLIEKCEVSLVDPDHVRFNGLNDEQWDEIKKLAHEMVNGRA